MEVTIEILKALAALGAAVSAGFGAVVGWRKWAQPHARAPRMSALMAFGRLCADLAPIIDDTPVHRALVLRAENGGGRPSRSKVLHSTVIAEQRERPLPSVVGRWNRVETDDDYRDILRRLEQQGEFTLRVEDLDPSSKLGNLYRAHGVTSSWVRELVDDDGARVYYLACNFTADVPDPLPDADIFRLRSCADRIADTLAEHLHAIDPR